MNYFTDIGLGISTDLLSENSGLFYAHWLVLKKELGMKSDYNDYTFFCNKMLHAYISRGLYLRRELHPSRTVSQDEISGMMISSFLLKTFHRKEIWSYLVNHFGNYKATGKNKFYNLGSFYSWAILAESRIAFLFAPLYFINLVIACMMKKENTSSKLIYFSELSTMPKGFLYRYYVKRMRNIYGEKWVRELFAIYFKSESADHPLIELSRLI